MSSAVLHLEQTIYILQVRGKAVGMEMISHSAKQRRTFNLFLVLVSCNLKDLSREDSALEIKEQVTILIF